MSVRVPFEWLLVASLMAGNLACAQQVWPPGSASAYSGYGAPAADYGSAVDPALLPGMNYCPPDGTPGLYEELLPGDRGFRFEPAAPLTLTIRQALQGTWGRIEYLQGNFNHDGGRTLGTPIDIFSAPTGGGPTQDVPDVTQQFPIQATDGSTLAGLAQVPSSKGTQWKHAQGIRLSFGIPVTDDIWVEGRFWDYEKQSGSIKTPIFPTTSTAGPFGTTNSTFLATTLTTDGVPGSRTILYDAGFYSNYTASYTAGDVALVFNWKTPEEGWRLQPMLGYRHDDYAEHLSFGGSFDNRSGYLSNSGRIATESNNITSNIHNLRDQMEVGMRLEWRKKFITLGVQERLGMGSNFARGSVMTSNLREPGTPVGSLDDPILTTSNGSSAIFAGSSDLDTYIDVRMNKWLKLRVGYSLIWLGNVATADQAIRFNEVSNSSGGTDPDVGIRFRYSDRVISALTLGGEIMLP